MGRKISKQVFEYAKEHNIDLKEIVGTGKDGNVLKNDLVEYIKKQAKSEETVIAEVIEEPEINYDDVLEIVKGGKLQKTSMELYQMTNSKTKGEYKSWNLQFQFEQVGEIDVEKLARFVAGRLHNFTATLVASGVKSSFSPSKPLWFKVSNGKQKLDFNLTMASTWNIFVKGKRGKNVLQTSELINTIKTVFAMNEKVAHLSEGDIFKELPKGTKNPELKAV